MGDLINSNVLLKKQILAEGERELKRLYQLTAGFTDPEPPTPEQVEQMEEGIIEL